MNKEDLKPCPFCGSEKVAVIRHKFRYLEVSYGIECPDCNTQSYQFFKTRQEAIDAWNTRKSPQISAVTEEEKSCENCLHNTDTEEICIKRNCIWAVKPINAWEPMPPEIIRCKDCKHRDPEDKKCDSGHGIIWQLPRDEDWYCADAER